ncbi:hypothetical protein BDK51DRAFT_30290 [Blyttiomyces helicus]|uniref:WD40-repeat-containing domain protein n=1 Tax=Blyttiomyces helicus TaxID=388810 RepID=A0A4P9WT46_9FUNG|nr:hypothetical protein BDK51DRAFT_30290 [Blyttiomyces helicus]|eukprot:RKO94226.1 hypothetical protein BDK51DRAFT_30290 [Blyttiomyces helicus]
MLLRGGVYPSSCTSFGQQSQVMRHSSLSKSGNPSLGAASADGKVWILDNDDIPRLVSSHGGVVNEVAFCTVNPDRIALNVSHVLVAERSGSILLYDLANRQMLFTFFEPVGGIAGDICGLTSADWNQLDPQQFGAVIGQKWFVWDMSQFPIHKYHHSGDAHVEGATSFRWSKTNPKAFATATRASEGSIVKVFLNLYTKRMTLYWTLIPQNRLT